MVRGWKFLIPIVAKKVMRRKPSGRPTILMNLAIGNLVTPPMMLERIVVVPVKGSREKLEVT